MGVGIAVIGVVGWMMRTWGVEYLDYLVLCQWQSLMVILHSLGTLSILLVNPVSCWLDLKIVIIDPTGLVQHPTLLKYCRKCTFHVHTLHPTLSIPSMP